VEESPELLRWRADLLMDEMMMGGADVSAADPGTRTFSGVERVTAPGGDVDVADPGRNGRAPADTGRGVPSGRAEEGWADAWPGQRATEDAQPYSQAYPPSYSPDREPQPGEAARYHTARPDSSAYYANGSNVNSSSNSSDSHGRNAGARNGEPGNSGPMPHPPESGTPARRGDATGYASLDAGVDVEPSTLRTRADTPVVPARERGLDLPSTPPRTHVEAAPLTGEGEAPPRSDRLYSVEQRYEQLRREQADKIEPAPIPPLPAAVKPPRTAAPPPDADDPTQWATGPEKWNWQDFGAQPGDAPEVDDAPVVASRYGSMDRAPQADNAAVRQDPAQFVNSMAVFENKKKRSTLLPRMSELDVETLQREISTLHGELALLLPVGNETGERARHLLDKAYGILQSDPMRSAEVEYYMQQVRTIVSRLHQARQWSELYRSRLQLYLWAWFGLSLVLLLARFIFQAEFDDFIMTLFGVGPESFLAQHWSAFLGTAFAGALGGAIGALYTMRVHARTEYGFFDRKYGLRGLILPIIGLLVGAIGYWVFGLVFFMTGINPAEGLVAGLIPAATAFGFGLNQESIYGTRG
jgi:hypothetical protein